MAKAQFVPPVRVFERGQRWWFDVRVGGKRVRRPGGRTEHEAKAAGHNFLGIEAHGNAEGTLGELLDRWIAFMQTYGRKPRSVGTSINCVERLNRYFDAEKPLREIDSDALLGFVRWRQSGPRHVGA